MQIYSLRNYFKKSKSIIKLFNDFLIDQCDTLELLEYPILPKKTDISNWITPQMNLLNNSCYYFL